MDASSSDCRWFLDRRDQIRTQPNSIGCGWECGSGRLFRRGTTPWVLLAAKVHSETERHFYRFRRAPAEFGNSESCFRVLMLTVVLAEDFKIQYDPERKNSFVNGDQR